ncbi:unnamed protein product [Ophioblennius macclurei]
MNKLRQSFRRKKDVYVPESSRPHQWQTDEEAVRGGKCSFAVKYLGHVEVEESRGMHICEEAVKRLKTAGKKAVRAVLWVSADGLRVVDDKTKDLILDQTIEKVSFCAPDRNFERAFSYICRDGTTRRWICHCFMAVKDSGERLSHAVGCAFAACLERKQKREKECGVTATFDANRTTFTREGSFRVTTATEAAEREEVMRQLQDAKKESEVKASEYAAVGVTNSLLHQTEGSPSPSSSPPLSAATLGPQAIPRRHAPAEALARQGSFRGFPVLSQKTSPFKRQLSLRINELPSTVQRKSHFPIRNTVPEVEGEGDSISSLCTQITTAFSGLPEDPFSSAPMPRPASSPQSPGTPANSSSPAFSAAATNPPVLLPAPPPTLPARDTNPWSANPADASAAGLPGGDWSAPTPVIVALPPSSSSSSSSPAPPSHRRTPSEADRWLEEVTKSVRAPQPGPAPSQVGFVAPVPVSVPMLPPRQPAFHPLPNGLPLAPPSVPVFGITPSQMVANVFGSTAAPPFLPPASSTLQHEALPPPFLAPASTTLQYEAPTPAGLGSFIKPPPPAAAHPAPPRPANGGMNFNGADGWAPPPSPSAQPPQQQDAFEAQWAALEGRSRQHASPSPTNPFSSELHKTFEIQL